MHTCIHGQHSRLGHACTHRCQVESVQHLRGSPQWHTLNMPRHTHPPRLPYCPAPPQEDLPPPPTTTHPTHGCTQEDGSGVRVRVENALHAQRLRSAMEVKSEFTPEDLGSKTLGKVLMEKAW